ncbi:polysaccharide pyruvyl transferase family protein [Pseudobutyrivibrio xylanivorans]|uniref:Polysaccharide pyruvyl transferase n=1 Tax=Pseudobutyrivibrio xylanivorans DSM 14809 TaxID=1123012 RepID=A0A1M6JQ84_PSEXY|nr:polysaccharide pyruvyl transferase family protein [Pseudobutyrivibrio xylanivorans]SHJ48885.1 Polysaccharide pyruvyl transferase [Pseudobutyrivibrio xylanivorans DSM 14809]
MRVGIITFHFVNNFGGALQAYALQRAVKEQCKVDVEIVDYRNWFIRFTDRVRLLPITTNVKEFFSGWATMGQRAGRRHKFGRFALKYSQLSRKYISHFSLRRCPPGDDKYICGSDQIWNPFLTAGVSYNYFLQFEKNPANKIAYAPSFGSENINKRYHNKIRNYIGSIGYLSVREKAGQEFIKELTGRDAERLIDPTFLLTKEDWDGVGCERIEEHPYILLYIMQRDQEVYEYARKIKEQMGIKLIEISRYGYNPGFVDETLVDVGPMEFLALFRDAEYVCTNSYHGLAFSIIFEKQFCLIPCKRFRARINNMLDLLQIDINSDGDDWESLTATYDREFVKEVIERERQKSIQYLKDSIGVSE